jgi:hypothetical protein
MQLVSISDRERSVHDAMTADRTTRLAELRSLLTSIHNELQLIAREEKDLLMREVRSAVAIVEKAISELGPPAAPSTAKAADVANL